MIPDSFIQELLTRIDIVEVVERYVPLKKAGANYVACCPFHSEKTPSFSVSAQKQFYHCFGCGVSGSAIGFLMQYAGLDFVDAVEELARSRGIAVPYEKGTAPHTRPAQAQSQSLYDRMAQAARFYYEQLKASSHAIAYLQARGISGEIAQKYRLGYAPDGWQPLANCFSDYDNPDLVRCGLVTAGTQGRRYDRFRDRIMFPIMDGRGNIIAFGARFIGDHKAALEENPDIGPKYLNSPETPIFEKGQELYGLPQARSALREENCVVVVEGYTDVVALAQHGIGHAVATLGTACTAAHVRKLLRQTDQVIFCFDGDAAGRKAAIRAMEASLDVLRDDKRIGFAFLPSTHDPDSFVREAGVAAFRHMLAQPVEFADFFMQTLKAARNPEESAQDRAQLLHVAKPWLQKLAAPLLRLQLTKMVARTVDMSQAEVEGICALKSVAAQDRSRFAPARKRQAPLPLAHHLLRIIVRQPAWMARIPLELLPRDSLAGEAVHALVDAVNHGELAVHDAGMMIEFVRGKSFEGLVMTLLAEEMREAEQVPEEKPTHSENTGTKQDAALTLEAEFEDIVARLHAQEVDRAIKQKQYASAEDLARLLAQRHQMDQRRQEDQA